MERLREDICSLLFHQTTRHVDISDEILEAPARLQLGQAQSPVVRHGHDVRGVSAFDHSHVHLGDNYYVNQNHNKEPDEPTVFGLCVGLAPLIDGANFIGRAAELDKMAQVLQPGVPTTEQRRLMLGGMGGIGKTQLAIAYARRHQSSYTSVFWLNATTELTVKQSFRSIAQQLLPESKLVSLDDEGVIREVFRWLSDMKNKRWLLIFDNHDEPNFFVIGHYMPNTAHGSIIVTTRLPDLVRGQKMRQVRVPPIDNLDESLDILHTRSRRENVKHDPDARRLAERLAGLPLALATAGTYLRKTTLTFYQYLKAYNERFNINPRRPIQLQEYSDRTLYTTWDLSYSRLESDNPLAAKTLKLLAYFDHQDIWFEVLHAGLDTDSPGWLQEIAGDHIDFENIMGALVDYSLVEAHFTTRSYSIHSCVHDWALTRLNEVISEHLYWYAIRCVVANIDKNDWLSLEQLRYARLARHALRCAHRQFQTCVCLDAASLSCTDQMHWVGALLREQVQLSAAEETYLRVLAGKEKALGPDHISTLNVMQGLSAIYRSQGKLADAEQLCLRALTGYEKALGPDHTSTLGAIHNLGYLYANQGKLNEAEQMYLRALAGNEKALGPDHTCTLSVVHSLGALYAKQGKLNEAEQMYLRALAGNEKAFGPDHTSTLIVVHSLGALYANQGKLNEAEQMYLQALAGKEKALGPDHTSTLIVIQGLGNLYRSQGRLAEAEQMCLRALTGYEKALGPDHTSTLGTIHNFGLLYASQGKPNEAEQMYLRALAGTEKALGPDHTFTLEIIHNLGLLYAGQGKLNQAEQMLLRALAGTEKALGPDHPFTLKMIRNLGTLYYDQGKFAEAERMCLRALARKEKALGPDHTSDLDTIYNLGLLCANQSKLKEAEQVTLRAPIAELKPFNQLEADTQLAL